MASLGTKPKVVIVGLLPSQHRVPSKALGRWLALQFVSTQTGRKVRAGSSTARVYIMTRFAKHGMTERLQDQFADVVLHSGGISQLIRRIAADFNLSLDKTHDSHD